MTTGWGNADSGGSWSALSSTISSVSGGKGWIQSPAPGRTSRVSLPITAGDSVSVFSLTVPTLPTGGQGLFSSYGARLSSDSSYVIGVRVLPGGAVETTLEKRVGFQTTTFQRVRLAQTVAAGGTLKVLLKASGTSPVLLQGKVWLAQQSEPGSPTMTYSDSDQGRLQKAGGIEYSVYTGPDTKVAAVGVDDLSITSTQSAAPATTPTPTPTTPPATNPPATSVPAGSTVSVSGARRAAGAAAPGTKDFAVPAGAVIVAPGGSDSGAGTVASPLKTIKAGIAKVANGGTIVLRGGAYHEDIIVPPQKKVTLQPYRSEAVWMDGAEKVGNWRASSGVWIRDGWTQSLDSSPTFTKGAADGTAPGWQFVNPAYPMASHPDQVWVAGKQLSQVGSRAAVKAGTFFVDEGADQLVIGSDPNTGSVEVSTLTSALSVRSLGSVVQGIGVRRYATSVPSMGSVIIAADDVSLSDVTVRNNSTTGLYTWSKNTKLTSVSLVDNGLLGMGAAHADGLRITGLLSTGNNSERFNRAPVSGAMKIHSSNGVVVTNSVFADNLGQGPWFDESNTNVTFTGNDSIRNTGSGFVFELSETATLANNLFASNGIDGVLIANSGNVSIWNNTFSGNYRNVNVSMNTRRSTNTATPWVTRNISVVNNVLSSAKGDCVVCVDDFSKNLTGAQMVTRSEGNLYQRTSATAPKVFAYWSKGAAGGSQVFSNLADFARSTGRDSQSRLVEGTAVLDSTYRLTSAVASLQTSITVTVPSTISAVSGITAGSRPLGAIFP